MVLNARLGAVPQRLQAGRLQSQAVFTHQAKKGQRHHIGQRLGRVECKNDDEIGFDAPGDID